MQKLRNSTFGFNAPKICEDAEGVKEISELLKKANKKLKEITDEVTGKVSQQSLVADALIQRMFQLGSSVKIGKDEIEAANARMARGNPPGKSNSIGDALHWEALLNHGTYRMDIVSRDADFRSSLNPSSISEFLLKEWKSAKSERAKPTLFGSLSEFFEKRFPSIELSVESKKNGLIYMLHASGSFAETHHVIAQLALFKNFTNNQVKRLFDALAENSQVRAIATDIDVHEFYLGLKDQAYWAENEHWDAIATALDVESDDFFLSF